MKNPIHVFLGEQAITWQGKMAAPLVVEGDLLLMCQEGSFAYDAFRLSPALILPSEGLGGFTVRAKVGGSVFTECWLDDLVAEHFGVERVNPMGHRPVGRVRITVEKLPDGDQD